MFRFRKRPLPIACSNDPRSAYSSNIHVSISSPCAEKQSFDIPSTEDCNEDEGAESQRGVGDSRTMFFNGRCTMHKRYLLSARPLVAVAGIGNIHSDQMARAMPPIILRAP